jgi:hypothetical protein
LKWLISASFARYKSAPMEGGALFFVDDIFEERLNIDLFKMQQ